MDILFRPRSDEMYAADFSVAVEESSLSNTLCGRSRPGHFRGVCTVVAKLFHILAPDAAVFGEKDFQQLAIIRRMVRDLNFPIEIIGAPTVREADGLACSSRNRYLSARSASRRRCLQRALLEGATVSDRRANGRRRRSWTRRATSLRAAPLARIDYLELVDAETLQPLETVQPEFASRAGRLFRPDSADRQYPAAMKEYDFVVIGSGIAGLTFALKAASARLGRCDYQTQRGGLKHGLGAGRHRVCDERRRFVRAACARHARSGRRALRRGGGAHDRDGRARRASASWSSSDCISTSAKSPGIASSISGAKAAIRSGASCTCRM